MDALLTQYYRLDPEVRALREENERLKKIIRRQALELEDKNELLKKAVDVRPQGQLRAINSSTAPHHPDGSGRKHRQDL
ncbi:MAG: hypothetical protein KFF73_14715 [Cyclobacteriaceae bacterium]|nr:hypothetical protein [Cyclobacteriaceae bacterium]